MTIPRLDVGCRYRSLKRTPPLAFEVFEDSTICTTTASAAQVGCV
jgi:hypothetical protein